MAARETASPELVEAVVARGRCVVDGASVRKLAGETVKIVPEEVESLRALGFIVDPKAKPIPVQQGPKLTPSDGPSVRLA